MCPWWCTSDDQESPGHVCYDATSKPIPLTHGELYLDLEQEPGGETEIIAYGPLRLTQDDVEQTMIALGARLVEAGGTIGPDTLTALGALVKLSTPTPEEVAA